MKNPLRQLLSFLLPVTVLAVVPWTIEHEWKIVVDACSVAGFILLPVGGILLVATIATLIRASGGTLAPWSPTRTLVVGGAYAYTRNPMISGVLILLLAESLVFHSIPIAVWSALFFILNNIYYTLSEEPGLAKRFGREYLEYKRNVPRWIPQTSPWKPPGEPGR